MRAALMSVTRSAGLGAALLLAAAVAVPALAQTSGGAAPPSGADTSRGLSGSIYQGQVGEADASRAGTTGTISGADTTTPSLVADDPPGRIEEFSAAQGNMADADEISSRLEGLGFTNVENARLSGNIYEADAQWNGEPVALRIDARTGDIEYDQTVAAAGGDMRRDRAASESTGARAPQPGETQRASVEVPLLWPDCAHARGQSDQMVECLNRQQLDDIARVQQGQAPQGTMQRQR